MSETADTTTAAAAAGDTRELSGVRAMLCADYTDGTSEEVYAVSFAPSCGLCGAPLQLEPSMPWRARLVGINGRLAMVCALHRPM